jgi:hypothetical protein
LLFVVPTKYPVSWQTRYFRPRQGDIVPVRYIAPGPIEKFCRVVTRAG